MGGEGVGGFIADATCFLPLDVVGGLFEGGVVVFFELDDLSEL